MHLKDEDKLFLNGIHDDIALAEQYGAPRFSFFLDEREQYLVNTRIKLPSGLCLRMFGGHEGAGRVIAGIFPDYLFTPEHETLYPIVPLTAHFAEEYTLTHRDFLGALMALKLKRSAVGDICIGTGVATLFVHEYTAPIVQEELTKAGRVGLKLSKGFDPQNIKPQEFLEIKGTVSSPRLDAIVALSARVSRERACELIRAGAVELFYERADDVSVHVNEGDIFSISGHGKFRAVSLNGLTKKGRIPTVINRYK